MLVVSVADGVCVWLRETVGVNVTLCVFELVSEALGVPDNDGVGDGLWLRVLVADPVREQVRDAL